MNERPNGESRDNAARPNGESRDNAARQHSSRLDAGQPERSRRNAPRDPGRRRFVTWLWRLPVIAAIAGAGYALYEGSRVLLGKEPAAADPRFEPVDPVTVAPLATFTATWDEVSFDLHGRPALAMRLPESVPGGLSANSIHLAGYSRVCTHQGCIVSLNRDTEAIAFGFNYRTDTPELVCPCHLSVFSPSTGGEAVSGPATEPLPRIELALDGDRVVAVGIESTNGQAGGTG